tara:strand:+ start:90 stop:1046 length:957 start_codon:yes stop_codon:yes gene_type:complete
MIKKLFLEIRSFFKDILLFASYSHKVPVSFIFNKLPYQNFRITIDFFLTQKYQKNFINKISNNKKQIFEMGNNDGIILNQKFFNDDKIEDLKIVCNELIKNYKKHNISIDDGGNLEKNSESFSKYYYLPNFNGKLSNDVLKLYNSLYSNEDLMNQLCFLAGINFKKNEISVHISKVKGRLLSDDWHSDCFGHTAKAFLYLQNIEKNNSPFCFLKKSHANKSLKMLNQIENSENILNTAKNKNMHGDDIWNKLKDSNYKKEIFNQSEQLECSYPKGTLITCDTSGFHKKGFSDGINERFMIGFVSKRGTMFEKFKSALF